MIKKLRTKIDTRGVRIVNLYSPIYLNFVACIIITKTLGVRLAGCSWGDFKTIKSGEISVIESEKYEKNVYTHSCIYLVRIKIIESESCLNHYSHIPAWNN